MIYLDNAATSFPKPKSVQDEVLCCIKNYGGNPGRGSHALSLAAADKIYECRVALSGLFGLGAPENAVFTLNLLSLYEPQVTQLALISSDYHIPTGILLFETRCILTAPDPSTRIRVVSNASCHGTAALSVSFQAAALSEIAGY